MNVTIKKKLKPRKRFLDLHYIYLLINLFHTKRLTSFMATSRQKIVVLVPLNKPQIIIK